MDLAAAYKNGYVGVCLGTGGSGRLCLRLYQPDEITEQKKCSCCGSDIFGYLRLVRGGLHICLDFMDIACSEPANEESEKIAQVLKFR